MPSIGSPAKFRKMTCLMAFQVWSKSTLLMSVYSQQQLTLVLNRRSSMSGNDRNSSLTKSTKDERVVFKTRKFFSPEIIVGCISAWRDDKQSDRKGEMDREKEGDRWILMKGKLTQVELVINVGEAIAMGHLTCNQCIWFTCVKSESNKTTCPVPTVITGNFCWTITPW